MEDIADKVQMAKGNLYYYFPSKRCIPEMQRENHGLGDPRRAQLERPMVFAERQDHGRSARFGIRGSAHKWPTTPFFFLRSSGLHLKKVLLIFRECFFEDYLKLVEWAGLFHKLVHQAALKTLADFMKVRITG